jgi:hypothetical protein
MAINKPLKRVAINHTDGLICVAVPHTETVEECVARWVNLRNIHVVTVTTLHENTAALTLYYKAAANNQTYRDKHKTKPTNKTYNYL